jgi:ketosteroid isomerase-like protein
MSTHSRESPARRSEGETPRQRLRGKWSGVPALCLLLALAPGVAPASADTDRAAVAALDTQYQAAVKRNDAAAMARILADDFVLVTGLGKSFHKADLLAQARSQDVTYEQQDEIAHTQTVRVWGDTAVVTALLWIKGAQAGAAFDYKLWFSDTYVRTHEGWRYVFGQAAQRLADAP